MRKLFTSESVTEGHPDKMADQIFRCHFRRYCGKRPNGPCSM